MRLFTLIASRYLTIAVLIAGMFSMAAKVTAQSSDMKSQTTLEQRLAVRQAAHKSDLTGLSMSRITTRCTAAQTKLSNLKTKREAAFEKRQAVYKSLSVKLENISKNLKKQQVNTQELVATQEKYDMALSRYLITAEKYKVALDDTITIDCEQNPNGFFASLLDSRKMRAQLSTEAAAIKNVLPELSSSLSSVKLSLIKGGEMQ